MCEAEQGSGYAVIVDQEIWSLLVNSLYINSYAIHTSKIVDRHGDFGGISLRYTFDETKFIFLKMLNGYLCKISFQEFRRIFSFFFIFLAQEFRVDYPVSQEPGSHFKSPISPWKSKKNLNGPRTSLMGPGGADLWRKKPDIKNLKRLWAKIDVGSTSRLHTLKT